MDLYTYLKKRDTSKTRTEVSKQYSVVYNQIKKLSPSDENFMMESEKLKKELQILKEQIEAVGGVTIAGIVTFNKKIRKSLIKNI